MSAGLSGNQRNSRFMAYADLFNILPSRLRRKPMSRYQRDFTCVIQDHLLCECFSAKVTVRKTVPIRVSLQPGQIDLADVFITPVSGQPTFKVHHHFVIYDFSGRGCYIVRDTQDRDEHRLSCTVWDLGNSFGIQVMKALRDLA
jgi:hypothetical protein